MLAELGLVGVKAGVYCTAALSANLLMLQMAQGGARFKSGERPPEDMKLALNPGGRNGQKQSFGLEKAGGDDAKVKAKTEAAARATRNHQNALENVPLALIVGWATILATKGASEWQAIFFILATVSRCLHSIAYARSLQPHRALAWLGAWVGVIGMLGTALSGEVYNFQ
eukprot:TRINITY_DN25080_c0_g1_i1.p1 TRINITY_DN25080_c0_g1~~TRINITY_DN25080_c0_g1_i1.p1  ORF type:complete len:170 (+),score=72.20 TRINITY_DN25080_c0_g1_i1:74-583(+)